MACKSVTSNMSVGVLGTVLIADGVMWGGTDAKIMIFCL